MGSLLREVPGAVAIVAIAGVGLLLANVAYDRGVPHYISRKIGHAAGGTAFLLSGFLFLSPYWPIILAFFFGAALFIARSIRPATFRGVGGIGRQENTMSEVWFAWTAVVVAVVAWLWLQKPFLGITCLLFMAWGDGITGLVRYRIYNKPTKGLWGSFAMLAVCLTLSWWLINPFWVGAVGSVVAVITEMAFGSSGILRWGDDNWAIPLTSLGTMLAVMAASGGL